MNEELIPEKEETRKLDLGNGFELVVEGKYWKAALTEEEELIQGDGWTIYIQQKNDEKSKALANKWIELNEELK